MAHTKDKHYWAQLRIALTAGSWGSSTPAKAFNGDAISWNELLRKFDKHCHGYADVSEIANQTQALALLVAAGPTDTELDDAGHNDEEFLALGMESVVASEHVDEARMGYEVLKGLESENLNSDSLKLALAYYAYSLGNPIQCLDYLGQVRELANMQSRLGAADSLRSNTSSLQAQSVSDNISSVSFIGSFVSSDSTSTITDIIDGKAWTAVEVVRSACLHGMSFEKITPAETSRILSAYLVATQALPIIESNISRSFPPNLLHIGPGHPNSPSFTRYRELWRWTERLLRRAIITASRVCSLNDAQEAVLWTLFSQYQTCSAHWPPAFRAEHRSTIATLFIRALILRARLSGHPPPSLFVHLRTGTLDVPVTTSMVLRRAIQDYRGILNASTRFPKAGEHNVKVEELTDLSVAAWEACGTKSGDAAWVMDVLWWATRLTFNAPRVFRHMMRVSEASGDTVLASRALRLYVQTVGKAKLAKQSMEPDATWVATLVWGVRMLCRLSLAADSIVGHRGIDEAREAGIILEKAKERLDPSDKTLKARVELAEGIWNTVMAIKEQDHLSRASRLTSALSLLESSIRGQPSSSAHFHIALALYRPIPARDLGRAIENARMAVELEPDNIRYLHLLGLLLSAAEDWRGAREVLEVGATLDEQTWMAEQTPLEVGDIPGDSITIGRQTSSTADNTAASTSSRLQSGSSYEATAAHEQITILDGRSNILPSAAELLQPLPDHPNPSATERFEHALQLRMTQLALAEFIEGPEGTEEKWIDVFQWFAKRRGPEKDQSREIAVPACSIPTERTSIETSRRSFEAKSESHDPRSMASHPDDPSGIYTPKPVSIPVTPASPAHDESGATTQNGTPKVSADDTEKEKEKDKSAGKKVQKMLKNRVHKEQRRISTIGRKIGHGVGRHSGGLNLRRTTSTPTDLYKAMGVDQASYQASSIHSRRHSPYASTNELVRPESPPPLPPSTVTPRERRERSRKERRLLSDLWLMSAATFRRSGKIEQARGAIQEAEVRDEENPNVWVQLGLYYTALRNTDRAVQAFNKALFIFPESIPATVHLCQSYLALAKEGGSDLDNIDLVAGMLSDLTQGPGWDVPEAWYFLGKAHGMREMRDRERECLGFALTLAEGRPLRDFGEAIGWCL
ncbi:hypothetical protein B0F90DRAFT_1848180 [Multifurca ochricompacta]|uniref:TPR-like protein n=1 Tax=Multifurca ochricompacta TaxID=376703 RepID=A0AAD4M327_9AGAM|nr:hypothetical protein B0F90DRAFT_1848180 [Multifurca ochricompacta]